MQEIFPPTLTKKLYRENDILIGTFLGGPLAGGYLLAQNFKALHKPSSYVTRTWLGTLAVFLVAALSSLVPVLDNLPTFVYSFVFCLTAHTVAKKLQGPGIALHREDGGRFYSRWNAAFVGLICLVLMLVLFFGLSFLQGSEEAD
jgi:hypothetical protein